MEARVVRETIVHDDEDADDIAMYDARKAELPLLRGNSHRLNKMKLSPLAVLGEIVWLMSQSKLHKSFFISDLEWFVMTPVILQQFRMFYDQDKPIGVVLWASVDAEVSARLAQGGGKMRPQDWKSGNELWAVEVIAPFGGAPAMLKDLKEKVFPSREIKAVVVQDGKKTVATV